MAVNNRMKHLYELIFDGTETWVANRISDFQENRLLKKYMTKKPIPSEFEAAYKDFWKKYGYRKRGLQYAWYYASQNGIMSPKYIPNDIYYTKIDQYFNQRKLGYGFNDKNYYSIIFKDVKQPETIVRKISGLLFDGDYKQLSVDEALVLISAQPEVICKPSMESGSGRGIRFWPIENEKLDLQNIRCFLADKEEADYIVQGIIKQHSELKRIHEKSINTVRICSILMEDGVHILSSCLRMGIGDCRIDNVTAGGISVGIKADGYIDNIAYAYYSGERFEKHPQGLVFEGFKVPSYHKAVKLVKDIHPCIGHFRLVSWDLSVDEEGDVLLIEANMRKGGINLQQFSNGPLFGDLTERVLDEVYVK